MTITTSINAVGILGATNLIQSARADAALEHREGLHTVTMKLSDVSGPEDRPRDDKPPLPAPQTRVVDITV
ncbi:hypothetical protein ACU4GR_01760 [Methylobacterium oryzae CBMB20]